jgi:hypothetical protein
MLEFGIFRRRGKLSASSAGAYRVTLITCRSAYEDSGLGPEQQGDPAAPRNTPLTRTTIQSLSIRRARVHFYSHLERENETPFTRENETTYLK